MAERSWNIRLGQILRQRLAELEKSQPARYTTRLQDVFFFHPEERDILRAVSPPADPLAPLDLDKNVSLYRKHFSSPKSPKAAPLNFELAQKLNATVIIIPAYGHQLINTSRAVIDEAESLTLAGFDMRYLDYADSASSSKACAKSLIEWFHKNADLHENIILIAYSYGVLAALDLFQDKGFKDIAPRVKALVSLGGPLGGAPEAKSPQHQASTLLIELFRKIQLQETQALKARLVKGLKELVDLEINWAQNVHQVIDTIKSLSEYMAPLPELIESLLTATPKWHKPEKFPDSCCLFSLSGLFPTPRLTSQKDLPQNLDDLFLFLSSKSLRQMSPYNDGVILTAESQFPQGVDAIHLGTLKADHWGLAYSKILTTRYEDPFPRPALLESVVILLEEYFRETAQTIKKAETQDPN